MHPLKKAQAVFLYFGVSVIGHKVDFLYSYILRTIVIHMSNQGSVCPSG